MSVINDKIDKHLSQLNLDLRSSKYRYTDQKVTPDVLAFIADCILNLPTATASDFTKNDVWHSDYFSKNVVLIYNKPDADNDTMVSEYDKFCAQPLKALSYAGILEEEKVGTTNHYVVKNRELLEYISLSDRNAFIFLCHYLEKVLRDSGYFGKIEQFIDKFKSGHFSSNDFDDLKRSFEIFTLGNSNIRQVVEIRRIFPKVLNVFAVANGAAGSKSGRVTDGQFLYSDLMYNAVNFRDIGKLKNVSRQEASSVIKQVEDYNLYEEQKAMHAVKNRHYPNSEVRDRMAIGEATQVHHIFPRLVLPRLRSTLENLILLTAQQHNTLAHPSNRTRYVETSYQITCLLSKSDSVKQSAIADDGFYSKEGLASVLNTGIHLGVSSSLSFEDINQRIRTHRLST